MVRPGKRLRESYRPGCSSSVRSSISSGYYNVSSEEGGGHESQRATVGLRTAGGRTRDAGGWVVVALLLLSSTAVIVMVAEAPQARPNGPRLYVLDGGLLKDQNPASYELTREQVAATDMSVPVFLVVHARGTLLWDTGLGDRFVGGRETPPNPSWQVQTTLRSQLAEIGYAPDRI